MKIILALALSLSACDRKPEPPRWQLVQGQFYDYEKQIPTTFLLDTQSGKVWYATPKSTQFNLTPIFEPAQVMP